MSKHETPMLLRLWEHQERGLLIEEFLAVRRSEAAGQRLLDGLIVLGEDHRRAARGEPVDVTGRDVVVVQAKASRLGMYLMGQALFSKHLMECFDTRSIRTIALCNRSDSFLEPLAAIYDIEVVVDEA